MRLMRLESGFADCGLFAIYTDLGAWMDALVLLVTRHGCAADHTGGGAIRPSVVIGRMRDHGLAAMLADL